MIKNKKAEEGDGIIFACGIFFGILILGLIWFINSSCNTPKNQLSDQDIVSKYIKEFYPEYRNCSVDYVYDITPEKDYTTHGANVYCNQSIPNRDSLSIIQPPTFVIKFKNDLSVDKIRSYYELKEGVD